jgi:hypothetical protein
VPRRPVSESRRDSSAHALVYLADEEDHGVPFPKGIEKVIEESHRISSCRMSPAHQTTSPDERDASGCYPSPARRSSSTASLPIPITIVMWALTCLTVQ